MLNFVGNKIQNMRVVLLALLLCSTSLFAQKHTVSGVVIDEFDSPVSYAAVSVFKSSDSTSFLSTACDSLGRFTFENLPQNNYFIRISSLGFKEYNSTPFFLSEDMKLETICLLEDATTLDAVTITSTVPLISYQGDKMIVNVENSATSAGNTAWELLEKSPGVIVDNQNGAINLLGKPGVLIQINGRQNYLSGNDLMEFLKSLTADQISRIEIITNPSSRYEASGNAGILNIVLKKPKYEGTNGSVTVGTGRGLLEDSRKDKDMYRGSLGVNLYHRSSKWNIASNINLLRDAFYSETNIARRFENPTFGRSEFVQQSQRDINVNTGLLRLGADYSISSKSVIGFNVSGNLSQIKLLGHNYTNIYNEVSSPGEVAYTEQIIPQDNPRNNFNTNLNFKHDFNDKGENLVIDVDMLSYGFKSMQKFDARFFDNNQSALSNLLQQSDNESQFKIYAAKADYTLPFANSSRLEFGWRSSFTNINSRLDFEYWENNQWNDDAGKTNRFKYRENVNAAYASYQRTIKKWSFQLGARTEYTNFTGHSVTLDSINKQNYISLFPTLFTSYNINDNNTVRLSYSKRIGRPRYDQLNPFIFVLDPYSYATGNPMLRPQISHQAELSYILKNYSLTFNFSRTNDLISELTVPNSATRITQTIETNYNYLNNFALNLYLPFSPFKFWQANVQASLYYRQYGDDNLLGGQFNESMWMHNFNVSNTFSLPKQWRLELSGWYQSPFIEGIVSGGKPRYTVNFGVNKSLWNQRANIGANISDIFYTSVVRGGFARYQDVDLDFSHRLTTRRVNISFTYNFGNQQVRRKQQRNSASQEEQQRVAN